MPHSVYDPHQVRHTLEELLAASASPPDPELHHLLWEACIAGGDRATGLAHQARAIALDPLRTHASATEAPPHRAVLALAVPGDFQSNLPLAMLFDGTTALHTLHLADPQAVLADPHRFIPQRLPAVDAVFIAIAEDEAHRPALLAADALAAAIGAPVINHGATIATMSREAVAQRLVGIPGAIVPAQRCRTRDELLAAPPRLPAILRPAGSHAGRQLDCVTSRAALARYLASVPGDRFNTAPFVNSRWADGLYRKIRVIFVDGRPYPLHLAIHDDWAVWYYNARMDRHPARRAEEARFLGDMEGAIGVAATRVLYAIAAAIGLDYAGLDAGLMPDGRLLVFEVETGMLVHDPGEAPELADRHAAHARIRRAVERMIDARGAVRRPKAAE